MHILILSGRSAALISLRVIARTTHRVGTPLTTALRNAAPRTQGKEIVTLMHRANGTDQHVQKHVLLGILMKLLVGRTHRAVTIAIQMTALMHVVRTPRKVIVPVTLTFHASGTDQLVQRHVPLGQSIIKVSARTRLCAIGHKMTVLVILVATIRRAVRL